MICWPSGGSLHMHDHGGSAEAFSVVAGRLDEATIEGGVEVVRTYEPDDAGSLVAVGEDAGGSKVTSG